MARLLGSEGLIMNQANGNAYMRTYSRGKNDVGPYIRFAFSNVSAHIHVIIKTHLAFSQTNGSFDFNAAQVNWNSLYCDSSGNVYSGFGSNWTCGANIGTGFSTSFRQADLWVGVDSNGGFPGKASICCEIYCDRWDYLNIANL